jgi:hypothetical protein
MKQKLKATPLMMILFKDVQLLEHDPKAQYKFNRVSLIFWLVNMPLVIVLEVLFPSFWLKISVMYLIQASLWALVATHFGAMSAALAANNTTATVNDAAGDIDDIQDNISKIAEVVVG